MPLSDAQELEVKRRFRKQSIRCVVFIAIFWITVGLYKIGADESAGTWFGLTIVVWGPPLAAGMFYRPDRLRGEPPLPELRRGVRPPDLHEVLRQLRRGAALAEGSALPHPSRSCGTLASGGPGGRHAELVGGKVALVAGATRGAGRGIAVQLGAAGATVYVTGRTTRAQRSEMDRPETIEETAALVDAAGGRGIAVQVDHLVPDEVRALVARIEREQGACTSS